MAAVSTMIPMYCEETSSACDSWTNGWTNEWVKVTNGATAAALGSLEKTYFKQSHVTGSTYGSNDNYYKLSHLNKVYTKWIECNTSTTWDYCNTNYRKWQWDYEHDYIPKVKTPTERMREILGSRHAPLFIPNLRKSLVPAEDVREQRARETLRRVIGEDKYFDFLKKGFISVRAKSGLSYQIFPAHGITCVYDKGIMVERLCVVLKGDFPATDSLIMRFLLILNNEQQFRNFAIKHSVTQRQNRESIIKLNQQKTQDGKSLVDIFREFKKVG